MFAAKSDLYHRRGRGSKQDQVGDKGRMLNSSSQPYRMLSQIRLMLVVIWCRSLLPCLFILCIRWFVLQALEMYIPPQQCMGTPPRRGVLCSHVFDLEIAVSGSSQHFFQLLETVSCCEVLFCRAIVWDVRLWQQ